MTSGNLNIATVHAWPCDEHRPLSEVCDVHVSYRSVVYLQSECTSTQAAPALKTLGLSANPASDDAKQALRDALKNRK